MHVRRAKRIARRTMRRVVRQTVQLVPATTAAALRDRHLAGRNDPGAVPALVRQAARIVAHRGIPVSEFRLEGDDGPLYANSASNLLRKVYWRGTDGHEPDLAALLPRIAADATSILEIGANVGYHTVQMAAVFSGERYLAIEPNPAAAAALRDNLRLNDLTGVEVCEVAATPHESGLVALSIPVSHFSDTPGHTAWSTPRCLGGGRSSRPSSRSEPSRSRSWSPRVSTCSSSMSKAWRAC